MSFISKKEWKKTTLGQMLTFQRGFDITKKEQNPGLYQVISSSGPKSTNSYFKVKGPGVVIGRKGTLGSVFYSDENFWPHDTTLWVKDFHGNNEKFAYYFLQTMNLAQYDCGASNPTINRNHIHCLTVSFPQPQVQKKIASILSNYDDLIENNTRRIEILEEMAKLIYEEWFVKFRFPGYENVKMVASELGKIPDGWELKYLSEVAEVKYGFPFKSKLFTQESKENNPILRIRDILNGFTTTFTSEDVDEDYFVKNGDILVGMDGDFHMSRWSGSKAYLNQRVVRFRPKLKNFSWYYLFFALKPKIKYFDDTITGTTVAHLSARDINSIKLVYPSEDILSKICGILEPINILELNLKIKNQNLRKTRDLLLSKLISGEIDVSEMDIRIRDEVQES